MAWISILVIILGIADFAACMTAVAEDTTTDFSFTTEDVFPTIEVTPGTCQYLEECVVLGAGLIKQPENPSCPSSDEDTNFDENVSIGCPKGYFVTNTCCVSQWWIIGLAAGIGAVIIIVLISVLIWLALDRKRIKKGKKTKTNYKSLEDGASLPGHGTGLDNPSYDNDGVDITGHSGPTGDGYSNTRGPPLVEGYHGTLSRDTDVDLSRPPVTGMSRDSLQGDDVSHTGYQQGHVANHVDLRDSNPRVSAAPEGFQSQLYDDIAPYHDPDRKSSTHGGDYVPPDRLQQPDYYNTSEWRQSDPQTPHVDSAPEIVPRTHGHHGENDLKENNVHPEVSVPHGIDMDQFKNFEANLDHVDPGADYKIKRPQLNLKS